ncbi:hypothetical protein IKP94_03750 [Candidatus Saccharibacteria bacterium]|nr:hypothetical protein [Candidatus Saccharibacteria bacterium]
MSIKVTVRPDIKLGTWQGMGGAITEATAYNFSKLSPQKRRKLIDAYFGRSGLDYRWIRVGIGSNDFCLKPYQYTYRPSLKDFSIDHDKKWVIPMLKSIKKPRLNIVASPWSPPAFMKTTFMQRFGGHLKPWHYGTYAKYIHKWLDAYRSEGIKVNYLTPQNEPHAIQIWESCLYSFRAQRRLAYKYLAKELANTKTQLLLWDHNKKNLTNIADHLFNGKYVTKYGSKEKIAGLCYHWYTGTFPDEMWQVRQKYPDIMLLSSEMCVGFSPYDPAYWATAANPYYYEIMSDINTGASAWIDWNMLLDWQGGPSYCKNYVKSPVILNEKGDDFILTPIYDALKKFAKLFPVGSRVIRCEYDSKDVAVVARKVKTSYEVVAANVSYDKQTIEIYLGQKRHKVTLDKLQIKKIKI